MNTDPISDSWAFLIGATSDQEALGPLRPVFVALFLALLLASALIALSNGRRDPQQRSVPALLTALCRVLIGIMWFQGAMWKMPLPVSGALQYWTEQMAANAAYPFVAALVRDLALPNMAVLDPLVLLLELALATSFILGVLTRPLASVGALYALGLWLGLYRHPAEWPWQYIFLAAAQCLLAVVDAGRSLGLDGLRRRDRGTPVRRGP